MEHFESPTHPNQIQFTSKLNMQKEWLELASRLLWKKFKVQGQGSVGGSSSAFKRNKSDVAKFD